jgi:hypothetical protein
MKCLFICVVLLAELFFAPGKTFAADLTNGALDVPWGASPAQARQIMEQNNYTFVVQGTEAGTHGLVPVVFLNGRYASYPAQVGIKIENNQMFEMEATLWEKENAGMLAEPFRVLNRLLTEKYGPMTRDISRNMPVECSGRNKYTVPITTYQWNNLGAAGLDITLSISPAFSCPNSFNFPGKVNVTYTNNGLYERLKAQAQQKI